MTAMSTRFTGVVALTCRSCGGGDRRQLTVIHVARPGRLRYHNVDRIRDAVDMRDNIRTAHRQAVRIVRVHRLHY